MSRAPIRVSGRGGLGGVQAGRRWIPGAGIALGVALTPFAVAARAQDAAPAVSAPSAGIEEVVITARRKEESAQDVPISVSAFGSEALETFKVEQFEDLGTLVPELTVSQSSGRPNSPVYSLRGIRPTESVYGQDPTVAVYFDEFVLSPAQGSNLGMYDLASLEVLKGPQGTLFGRNTTGGAILLAPKRPGYAFGSDVMVGYGSYGLVESQVGMDMPFSDNFRARLSGRSIDSDGYQTNIAEGPLNGTKLGGERTRGLRLSTVWDINDWVENYTVASWDHKLTNGRGTKLIAVNPNSTLRYYDGPDNPNGELYPGESLPSIFDALERSQNSGVNDVESDQRQFDDIEAWSIINTTKTEFDNGITFKLIGGYRDVKAESSFDIDASQIPGLLTSNQKADLQHGSVELQLLGSAFNNRLEWQTGMFWYNEQGLEYSPGYVLQGLNRNTPTIQSGEVDNTSASIFGQASLSLTDKWSLTAGARMTRDKKKMTLATSTPAGCSLRIENPDDPSGALINLPADQCALPLSDTFEQPTASVSLEYRPRRAMMLYASTNYGYRSGGFNIRATQPQEYKPFDPETVIDSELGMKVDYTAGDWAMRTNLAVYNQWYDDIQRTQGVNNAEGTQPGSTVINAAKAKVFGLELSQTISPVDNVSLVLNYAYVDPKYDNWTDKQNGTDYSETPFFFTPKHSATATLTVRAPLDPDVGELTFGASAAYKSMQWIDALHTINIIEAHPEDIRWTLKQGSYWLLDLNASWLQIMGSNLDVTAYVKNATDEEYAVGGVQLYTTLGMAGRAYGEPITYGMQLRYHF